MAYSKQIFEKVQDIYSAKRANNNLLLKQRRQEVYDKIPEIKKIDEMLSSTGAEVSRAVLSGKDVEKNLEKLKAANLELNMKKCELLVDGGYPSTYLTSFYECDICKDEGFIDGRMCDCFHNKLKEEAYKTANLPMITDEQGFDGFNLSYYSDEVEESGISPRQAMEYILNYCKKFVSDFDKTSENLFFYGDVGLGKTYLSSCIAGSLIEQGKTVFYQTAYKILSIMEEYKFSQNKDKLKMQIDMINNSDLLIIDDLGTEFINSLTTSLFFELINSRLNSGKKMVISTNLSMEEITNVYSYRVTSRIIGNFAKLKFYGDDLRITLS